MASLTSIPKKKKVPPKTPQTVEAPSIVKTKTPKTKMSAAQELQLYKSLPKGPDGKLVRQISDSDKILRMMTTTVEDQHRLMGYLERCLHRWNGYARYGVNNDDIYWYARNGKVHLSLHYGGSNTAEGAIHIKYITEDHNTVNFRIDVSETMRTNPSVNENRFNGRYITMNKRNIIPLSPNSPEYLYCQDIINSICQCLDTYIAQFMGTMGGKVNSRRRSQSYVRKTRKKNKTRRKKY